MVPLKLVLTLLRRVLIQRNWAAYGMLPTGDDGFMAAACRGHGAEVGQAIGEHLASGHQMVFGPVSDCL